MDEPLQSEAAPSDGPTLVGKFFFGLDITAFLYNEPGSSEHENAKNAVLRRLVDDAYNDQDDSEIRDAAEAAGFTPDDLLNELKEEDSRFSKDVDGICKNLREEVKNRDLSVPRFYPKFIIDLNIVFDWFEKRIISLTEKRIFWALLVLNSLIAVFLSISVELIFSPDWPDSTREMPVVPAVGLFYFMITTVYLHHGGNYNKFYHYVLARNYARLEFAMAYENITEYLSKEIKPTLRTIINDLMNFHDVDSLSVRHKKGLFDYFDLTYYLKNKSYERVVRNLSSRVGACVGIAGPRGVGKTTLLRSLVENTENEPPVPGRRGTPITVYLSAPVEYEPRAFILHVFSAVCEKILEKRKRYSNAVKREAALKAQYLRDYTFFFKTPGGIFLNILCVLILGASLYTAIFLPGKCQSEQNSSSISFVHGLLEWLLPNGACGPEAFAVVAVSLLISVYLLIQMNEQWVRGALSTVFLGSSGPAIRAALRSLGEIKFQQSFSSGWSGSFGLPAGLKGGVKETVAVAPRQRSLPDIVTAYRSFIEEAPAGFYFVIAIDELDKMQSDDKAQQFLNDIKVLFNLKNCYYLVSVSESAMASFERRGLPFRDTFDSSFDDIVYVPYMTLNEATDLIARRVIGVPVPYRILCYSLAGGLPRDLIRSCQSLLAHADANGNDAGRDSKKDTSLAVLSELMIREEVDEKMRASRHSLRNIHLEPFNRNMMKALHDFEMGTSKKGLVGALAHFRQKLSSEFVAPKDATVDQRAAFTKLDQLRGELHAYAYYAICLFAFFGPGGKAEEWGSDEKKWEQEKEKGRLAWLGRARESFANHPLEAETLLDAFYERYLKVILATINRAE